MTGQIVLLPRVLEPRTPPAPHMSGDDAKAVDRALARAGLRKWGWFNGVYGKGKVSRVRRFQLREGLVADGRYGEATHKKLVPYFDQWGAKLMNDMAHRENGATRAVAIMLELYNARDQIGYTQGPARMMIVRLRLNTLAKITAWLDSGRLLEDDCSGIATGVDYGSDNPDPNDRGYDGQGYTGTLAEHGVRTANPTPGDTKGFYDSPGKRGWPFTHVVTVLAIKSDGRVLLFSLGKTADPAIHDHATYRPSDFVMWRRYPIAA